MQDVPDGRSKRLVLGRLLEEPARFAYAGLCAISLAQLFPEREQRDFCQKFVEDLVRWLDLSPTVIPAMEAFASGLGGEGTETFTKVLLEDSVMKEKPTIIMQDLVSFSLRDGFYDARSRVLISHVSWLLRVPPETMELSEESLMESLKQSTEEPSESVQASRRKKESRKKMKRYLLIGLATVGGGTVIGLTGGLAAPLVAAGAATIIGSAGAAVLGSTAGIAIMASLFGAAGAGLTGYKMKKRVGAIEEFEFLPLTGGRQLHVAIAITGWLSTGKYGSFAGPWHTLLHSTEQYCLAWESKYLMELGNTLDALLNGLVNIVAQEALKYTILSGIVAALTWPASLITVASVIDNPWGVCLSRSAEVGKHLAHILLGRQQGHRPVTLIGFSLGARVIYFCLQELAQESGSEGIIEDVVLLGAPVEGDVKRWKALTRVVAGRIINGYCRGDWLLSFVYRSSSAKLNVAGLQPVDLDDRRMVNVDLSSVVNGHLDYMKQMDTLLKAVGIKTTECRFEEQSGLLRPLAAEPTQSAPTADKEEEWSPWDWEPVCSGAAQDGGPQRHVPGPSPAECCECHTAAQDGGPQRHIPGPSPAECCDCHTAAQDGGPQHHVPGPSPAECCECHTAAQDGGPQRHVPGPSPAERCDCHTAAKDGGPQHHVPGPSHAECCECHTAAQEGGPQRHVPGPSPAERCECHTAAQEGGPQRHVPGPSPAKCCKCHTAAQDGGPQRHIPGPSHAERCDCHSANKKDALCKDCSNNNEEDADCACKCVTTNADAHNYLIPDTKT